MKQTSRLGTLLILAVGLIAPLAAESVDSQAAALHDLFAREWESRLVDDPLSLGTD